MRFSLNRSPLPMLKATDPASDTAYHLSHPILSLGRSGRFGYQLIG